MTGDDRKREPLSGSGDKANRTGTSRNRGEPMTDEDPGEQSPRESGTTSLGGESRDSEDGTGPGGVEGTN